MEDKSINKSNDNTRIELNVGGSIFQCCLKTLRTFPDTILANLNEEAEQYHSDAKKYFFNRNPDVFKNILDA